MNNIQKGGAVSYDSTKGWVAVGDSASGKADAKFFNFLSLSRNDLLSDANTTNVVENNEASEDEYYKIRNNSVYFRLWRYPLQNEGFMNSQMWKDRDGDTTNRDIILNHLKNISRVRLRDIINAKNNCRQSRGAIARYNKATKNHINLIAYVMQLYNLIVMKGSLEITENINAYDRAQNFDIELTPGFQELKSSLKDKYIIEESSSRGAAEQTGGTKQKKTTKKKKKSKTKKKKNKKNHKNKKK